MVRSLRSVQTLHAFQHVIGSMGRLTSPCYFPQRLDAMDFRNNLGWSFDAKHMLTVSHFKSIRYPPFHPLLLTDLMTSLTLMGEPHRGPTRLSCEERSRLSKCQQVCRTAAVCMSSLCVQVYWGRGSVQGRQLGLVISS